MKISILTHPPKKNYGGILQALALSAALKNMGHEVQILNGPFKKLSFTKRISLGLKTLLGKNPDRKFFHLQAFVEKHLPVTEIWRGKAMPSCDAIVVGSDQVWRPDYTHFPGAYFLDFVPEDSSVRRIAYAASFGVENWLFTGEQTAAYGTLLKKFAAVSCREDSGVQLCREHFDVTAEKVPDPTLLHDADFYRQYLGEASQKQSASSGLFTYFLDPDAEKIDLARELAVRKGWQWDDFLSGGRKKSLRPVGEFLAGIAHAEFVLTDSFHGMVFSMIFGKPYAIIGNAKRGLTRFDLTVKAGMPEALLTGTLSVEDCLALAENSEKYSVIQEYLIRERSVGMEFLHRVLDN